MDIIGESKDKYICIVGHTELEKFLGQYYGQLKRLNPGDTIDLGRGYDFHESIVAAMNSTSEMIHKNKKIIEAILNGISVINKFNTIEDE